MNQENDQQSERPQPSKQELLHLAVVFESFARQAREIVNSGRETRAREELRRVAREATGLAAKAERLASCVCRPEYCDHLECLSGRCIYQRCTCGAL